MGENTAIEWSDHTFNPWRGCQKVSPGCANCYAETMSHRNPEVLGEWGPPHATERVIAAESYWRKPVAWNRAAAEAGRRDRVFCASLADVFEDAPQVAVARARLWLLIEDTPSLDWLLLTKRPENVNGMVPQWWAYEGWPPNVWLGTSVEDQERADERIPHLLGVPAAVRFLSCEPLLGPVDLRAEWIELEIQAFGAAGAVPFPRVDWVIVGGESGPGARPMHPDWPRNLRDQAVASGVPFFFKQWGNWTPVAPAEAVPGDVVLDTTGSYWVVTDPLVPIPPTMDVGVRRRSYMLRNAGKKAAGRVLDGRTWDEMPTRTDPRHG